MTRPVGNTAWLIRAALRTHGRMVSEELRLDLDIPVETMRYEGYRLNPMTRFWERG